MNTLGTMRTVGLAALGMTTLACGPDPVTLPDPPQATETAALVATYQMPTANLDASNIQQVATDAQARLADLHLEWLPGLWWTLSRACTDVWRRAAYRPIPPRTWTPPVPSFGRWRACTGSAPAGRIRRVPPIRRRTEPLI